MSTFLRQIFLILTLLISLGRSYTCESWTIEEGHSGELIYNISIGTIKIRWLLVNNTGSVTEISSCSVNGQCNNSMPELFKASVRISQEDSAQKQSVLFIVSARRRMTEIRFAEEGGGTNESIECGPIVFVRPENSTCSSKANESSSEIILYCNSSRVYQHLKCLFVMNFQGDTTVHKWSGKNGEDPTLCSVSVNVTGRSPGDNKFIVALWLLITGTPLDSAVIRESATLVDLRAPTVALGKTCPDGPSVNGTYIDKRYAANTTCSCELVDEGFPPGQATWYDMREIEVGSVNSNDRSSVLTLHFTGKGSHSVFACGATTVLNASTPQIPYWPQFAYGPHSVIIETSHEVLDLCNPNMSSVIVTCRVPIKDVNPEPNFTILIDSRAVVQGQTGSQVGHHYSFIYKLTPRPTSVTEVTCLAGNSRFSDLYASKSTVIFVKDCVTSSISEAMLTTVLGASLGSTALIVIAIIVVACVCKQRKRLKSPDHSQFLTPEGESDLSSGTSRGFGHLPDITCVRRETYIDPADCNSSINGSTVTYLEPETNIPSGDYSELVPSSLRSVAVNEGYVTLCSGTH